MTQCQLLEYWSFLFHMLFIRVYDDKYSNAMHINNCSLVRHKRKKKRDFQTPPPQTKIKPPNALYAKYSISFFWGGHSQNDLTTIKKYFTPISLLSSISLLREPKPFTESPKTRFIFTLGFLHPVSIFQTWIVFHVFLKATYGKAYLFCMKL